MPAEKKCGPACSCGECRAYTEAAADVAIDGESPIRSASGRTFIPYGAAKAAHALLTNSLKDIAYRYESLTATEKSLVNADQFNELATWMRAHRDW